MVHVCGVIEHCGVDVWVTLVSMADFLLVVNLRPVGTPHEKLPMETPLRMHEVEQPMGVLACGTPNIRGAHI